jgi:hypothetical protein
MKGRSGKYPFTDGTYIEGQMAKIESWTEAEAKDVGASAQPTEGAMTDGQCGVGNVRQISGPAEADWTIRRNK